MRNNLMKLTLLGVFISGFAYASEMRSPWLSEKGSIGYRFEKSNPDRYSLNIYSAAYLREAHKAFMKHSTDTEPLSKLFFNKSDFVIADAFPNRWIPLTSVNYNPFLAVTQIHPRVTYYEWGMNLGGRFEYPVYKDKGRIGLRANIPFRCIEIERENMTDQSDDPVDDLILSKIVRVETNTDPSASTEAEIVDRQIRIYNLGFVSNLQDNTSGAPLVKYENNKVSIGGQNITSASANFTGAAQHDINGDIAKTAGIIYNQTGKSRPQDPDLLGRPAAGSNNDSKYRWAYDFSSTKNVDFDNMYVSANGTPATTTLQDNYAKGIYFFTDNQNYLPFEHTARTPALQEQLNDMWIALGWTGGSLQGSAETIDEKILLSAELAREHPYQWLSDTAGYEFETSRRSNLGDIDLDLFYEHIFSDAWIAEAFLGVRFPTGVDDDYCNNPYKVHTGNGEHWEIRFGGLVAWEPLNWLNLKLDLTGAYAFEGTENRPAVFEGSDVKNIGPCVGADVDWWYFVARLDFNFFHPKNKDISSTLGYEFYYKTKDDLHFKQTKMVPFYGNNIDGTTNEANLSNSLAEANTESISHKVRFEGAYNLCPWLQAYAGGSYTFAGQYVIRDGEAHCGVNVKF